jgi:hypothetical protein
MKGAHVSVLTALVAFGLAGGAAFAEPRLSDAEFARLSKQLHVKSQTWASLPWKASVTEARQQAAREKKPIFFNVNTGNGLGFT